jgi:dipeptidase E
MKLLLTSAGITNQSLAKALSSLLDKPMLDASIVFVATAANTIQDDKNWLEDNYNECKSLKPKSFEVVDIAESREQWEPALIKADIIFVGGGDTYYLMEQVRKSGLGDMLPQLLKTKVYVGISAGSSILSPSLLAGASRVLYDEVTSEGDDEGLGIIDFHVLPHLNSEQFPNVKDNVIRKCVLIVQEPVYAIDDGGAVKVEGSTITIVTEGAWKKYA